MPVRGLIRLSPNAVPLSLSERATAFFAERVQEAMGEERFRSLLAHLEEPNEFGITPSGLDPRFALAGLWPMIWLHKYYFRVLSRYVERVPSGPVMIIANHSGQLPFDGAMLAVECLLRAPVPRLLRSMGERWIATLPFFGALMARAGQILGSPANCKRLLAQGQAVLAFPEGVRGMNKLFTQRYRLQEFGDGFARIAIECGVPILPAAVVGAEEQAPALVDVKPVAALLHMPAAPLTPQVIPLPLPTRHRILFGEPILLGGDARAPRADLEPQVERVRRAIAQLIAEGLAWRGRKIFL